MKLTKTYEKEFLTIEQVFLRLDEYDKQDQSNGYDISSRDEFEVYGFRCIQNWCKLEKGWISMPEEICEYCVRHLVSEYGTKSDRIKFNENSDIGKLPLDKKTIHTKKKSGRKKHKRNMNPFSYREGFKNYFFSTKDFNNHIKQLKMAGISTLRRTKDKAYKDLYKISADGELQDYAYAEIKGLEWNHFYACVETKDELLGCINSEILEQNTKCGKNIPIIDSVEKLEKFLRKRQSDNFLFKIKKCKKE